MESLNTKAIEMILHHLNGLMEQRCDLLMELDRATAPSEMGMSTKKVIDSLDSKALVSDDPLPGRYFVSIGSTLARRTSSNTGTILAMGFMKGGTALKNRTTIDVSDLARFARTFIDEIIKIGKTKTANKLVIDALNRVVVEFEHSAANGVVLTKAFENAAEAVKSLPGTTEARPSWAGDTTAKQEWNIKVIDPGLFLVALIFKWISEAVAQVQIHNATSKKTRSKQLNS